MNRFDCCVFVTVVAACASACAGTSDESSPTDNGKADGAITRLRFADDFTQTADGPLVAGLSIRVSYDLDRMTTCKSSSMGSEGWGVTGFASFDGGEPQSFAVSRLAGGRVVPLEAELALPARATHVAMWFQINDRFGCNAFDSDFGSNYQFDLEQRAGGAVLDFGADFNETASATIHAGDRIVIHYEPARLASCAASTGGHVAWGITGFWQVDGGDVHSLTAGRADGTTLVAADPELTVPRGSDLALWFEASSVFGCHGVDSDFGANYHFAIAP